MEAAWEGGHLGRRLPGKEAAWEGRPPGKEGHLGRKPPGKEGLLGRKGA